MHDLYATVCTLHILFLLLLLFSHVVIRKISLYAIIDCVIECHCDESNLEFEFFSYHKHILCTFVTSWSHSTKSQIFVFFFFSLHLVLVLLKFILPLYSFTNDSVCSISQNSVNFAYWTVYTRNCAASVSKCSIYL